MKNHLSTGFRRLGLGGLIALCSALPNSAGDPIGDPWAYIENEQVIGENKLPAHAGFRSFTTIENALNPDQPPRYWKSLDGRWSFKWVRGPADRPTAFMDPSQDLLDWDTIAVPGNWEIEGHGVPIYVNHPYEFADYRAPIDPSVEFVDRRIPKEPGKIPHSYNPVGSYRRTFTVDENWLKRDVFLNIGAMKSGGFVWLNGHYVGYSQGSKLAAEFNLTPFLRAGDNTLALQIYRWTDGAYLEGQDFWRLSGIERSVFIYAQPKQRIADFEAHADLDDSYRHGRLSLTVDVANSTETPQSMTVGYRLFDADGEEVASGNDLLRVADTGLASFQADVPAVRSWSAEHPNLYTLLLYSQDSAATILEAGTLKIGFRRVEIRNGRLKLNGQAITLRGVNSQEHDPETGHVVDEALILKDIRMWKENHINAVRLSHYPRGRRFYELCDQYGLYVVDEANIESHGMYYGAHTLATKANWKKAHLDRMTRMVRAHRNHPSIIIWSMGNEAGNGATFSEGYRAIKELDPAKRPVQYERTYKDHDPSLFDMHANTDIIVPQYPSPATFETLGKVKTDRPFIPSEYAHAMGNSTGNFADYWQFIDRYDNLQGGFIWDWVDQSIWATRPNGARYYAYGGDFGSDMPTDNSFLNNGIVFPDRTPQPALYEVRHVHQPIKFKSQGINRHGEMRVLVENFYDFTPLENFDLTARIQADGKTVKTLSIDRIDVEPQTGKLIRIPLDDLNIEPNTEYFLELSAKLRKQWGLLSSGFEIAREQIELTELFETREAPLSKTAALSVDSNDHSITISSAQAHFAFDRALGRLTSYKYRGRELLHQGQGPQATFWRPPTDNDLGNRMHIRNIAWKQATLEQQPANLKIDRLDDGRIALKVLFDLPAVGSRLTTTYTFSGDGTILVENRLTASSVEADIPRIGMALEMPSEYQQLAFFGRGPWENYPDRKSGAFVDLYRSTPADQYVPYIRPQENGYKTGVRWAALAEPESSNGLLIVAHDQPTGLGFSALNFRADDFDVTAGLDYDVEEAGNNVEEAGNDAEDVSHGSPEINFSKHIDQISPRDAITVHIDLAQRGLGGDDSWYSLPQQQYLIDPGQSHEYCFYLIPFQNGSEDRWIELAKEFASRP